MISIYFAGGWIFWSNNKSDNDCPGLHYLVQIIYHIDEFMATSAMKGLIAYPSVCWVVDSIIRITAASFTWIIRWCNIQSPLLPLHPYLRLYDMDKYGHLINKIIVMNYCRLSLSLPRINQFARLDYVPRDVELFALLICRIDTLVVYIFVIFNDSASETRY